VSTETVFVVNPASGNGKTGRLWPEMLERAAARGLRGETLLTEGRGHASSLAEEAAANGARVIVVVGGDGTVNEAVNGLRRAPSEHVELAILPRGTGDDFARTFGIPGNFDHALEIAANGRARTLDIGRARYVSPEGSEEERYFVNFAGAGISGAIAKRGAATSRRLGARLAYFWATIAVFARWKSSEMTLEIDGERRMSQLYEVIVANGAYVAGGMRIAPEASPDDGLFETVLIGDFTKAEFMVTFPKIYRGTHVGHRKVEILRASTVGVDATVPLPVVLDGEQPGVTPARFEIVPSALRVRVPAV
jgi:diacylglycerol kinase (ATP)